MRGRLRRFLPTSSVTVHSADRAGSPLDVLSARPAELDQDVTVPDIDLVKPPELTWWDWTVLLLHSAAEVEHALLVQYLYAAYSLAERGFAGPSVPADPEHLVRRWRRTIVGIAREEMGHLLTLQNLLRFIGGPLNFDREDFPFLSALYPFHFRLEPLSKDSLAKYVSAEMPAHPSQTPEEILEVTQRATHAGGGAAVNRVGRLYAHLAVLFGDPARLPDDLFRPETADMLQARPEDWQGSETMIVRDVRSRGDALAAITSVGQQGEGPWIPEGAASPSHFDRFW